MTDEYCAFFDMPMKVAIRNYFNNECFECEKTIADNKNRKMSVHHVNYQKRCGCDNTQFCIYVPLCGSCHIATNHNRWHWYIRFMIELALRNPNYYAYHIPVVFYDEPCYNFDYVFQMRKKNNHTIHQSDISVLRNVKNKTKHNIISQQITVHISEEQKNRISELPEGVTFSMLVRDYFNTMMYEIENKNKLDIKAA